jgi:hypothetical protein
VQNVNSAGVADQNKSYSATSNKGHRHNAILQAEASDNSHVREPFHLPRTALEVPNAVVIDSPLSPLSELCAYLLNGLFHCSLGATAVSKRVFFDSADPGAPVDFRYFLLNV